MSDSPGTTSLMRISKLLWQYLQTNIVFYCKNVFLIGLISNCAADAMGMSLLCPLTTPLAWVPVKTFDPAAATNADKCS